MTDKSDSWANKGKLIENWEFIGTCTVTKYTYNSNQHIYNIKKYFNAYT